MLAVTVNVVQNLPNLVKNLIGSVWHTFPRIVLPVWRLISIFQLELNLFLRPVNVVISCEKFSFVSTGKLFSLSKLVPTLLPELIYPNIGP